MRGQQRTYGANELGQVKLEQVGPWRQRHEAASPQHQHAVAQGQELPLVGHQHARGALHARTRHCSVAVVEPAPQR